jgi:nucleoside-diphosphate-sugar epimerase
MSRSPWAREYLRRPHEYIWGTEPSAFAHRVLPLVPGGAREQLGAPQHREHAHQGVGVAGQERRQLLGAQPAQVTRQHVDDLVEGFRLCGETPAAAGRTYILAGAEVTTLNELVRLIAAEARVPPPWAHLPVWPFWLAGALCEAVCVPLKIEPPIYRRRVDFFTKSRAFDISRARAELGYAPQVSLGDGIARTLSWYRQRGWI